MSASYARECGLIMTNICIVLPQEIQLFLKVGELSVSPGQGGDSRLWGLKFLHQQLANRKTELSQLAAGGNGG